MEEENKKIKKTISVIRRRSANYTTHYCNGAVFHTPESGEGPVVLDFLFRSEMPGEPYKADVRDDDMVIQRECKMMTTEECLVGIALGKETLLRIAAGIIEIYGPEGDALIDDVGK